MECRKLEITLVSANDLPDIRSLWLMKVYAKVFLKGFESKTSKKTPVDKQGDVNPKWNFPVEYTLSESTIQQPGVNVVVELYCKRTRGDKVIGKVNIPVKSLFDKGMKAEQIMSYVVAGTPNGRLNILYSFGEKIRVQKTSGSGSGSGRKTRAAMDVGLLVLRVASILLNGGDVDDGDQYDDVNSGDDYCEDDYNDDVFYCDEDDVVFCE